MAGATTTYHRNWSSSDTTTTSMTAGYAESIESLGWTAPTGYSFKEWNTTSSGTGRTFQPGDFADVDALFAIWEAPQEISKIIIPDGTEYDIKDSTARTQIASKQDTLVSGTNIKTINGNSLLGSGDLTVGGGVQSNWNETDTTSLAYIQNKPQLNVLTATDDGNGNVTLTYTSVASATGVTF